MILVPTNNNISILALSFLFIYILVIFKQFSFNIIYDEFFIIKNVEVSNFDDIAYDDCVNVVE
jgi:hypothetical protein